MSDEAPLPPCDYCGEPLGDFPLTIIIDIMPLQFCSLSCAIGFLQDLMESYARSRQHVSLN